MRDQRIVCVSSLKYGTFYMNILGNEIQERLEWRKSRRRKRRLHRRETWKKKIEYIEKKKKRRRNRGEKVIWTSEKNKIEVKKKTDNIKEWKREENIVNKYINKMSEKIMTGKNERNH